MKKLILQEEDRKKFITQRIKTIYPTYFITLLKGEYYPLPVKP